MYSTCIHCLGPLGANERLEHMPVGHRLAFDATKGRLWVVCPRCRRWNLTPLEERWETVETCERLYRDTHVRISTDNIGLVRLPDDLELIRIGKPMRPEIAAWRYGVELLRRRRRMVIPTVGGMVVLLGLDVMMQIDVLGVLAGMGGVLALMGAGYADLARRWSPRIELPDGRIARLGLQDAARTSTRVQNDRVIVVCGNGAELDGVHAQRAMRSIMAAINRAGGSATDVRSATALLDRCGSGSDFVTRLARTSDSMGMFGLGWLPADVRIALEMSIHEETEHDAAQGELAALTEEWRHAEEIAAIADDLLLPPGVRERLESAHRLREG